MCIGNGKESFPDDSSRDGHPGRIHGEDHTHIKHIHLERNKEEGSVCVDRGECMLCVCGYKCGVGMQYSDGLVES